METITPSVARRSDWRKDSRMEDSIQHWYPWSFQSNVDNQLRTACSHTSEKALEDEHHAPRPTGFLECLERQQQQLQLRGWASGAARYPNFMQP